MELEDYVSLSELQGRLDSSGRFTFDPAQALRKMSRSLLPDDVSMLLKLVQGCVGFSSQEMWISASPRELHIFVTHRQPAEIVERIGNHFVKLGANFQDLPENDVLLGLCHRLQDGPSYLGISHWESDELRGWHTFTGEKPEKIPTPPLSQVASFGLHLQLGVNGQDLKMDLALWAPRAFFAPLPIHYNSTLLGSPEHRPFSLTTTTLEYHRTDLQSAAGALAPRWLGLAYHQFGKSPADWIDLYNKAPTPVRIWPGISWRFRVPRRDYRGRIPGLYVIDERRSER